MKTPIQAPVNSAPIIHRVDTNTRSQCSDSSNPLTPIHPSPSHCTDLRHRHGYTRFESCYHLCSSLHRSHTPSLILSSLSLIPLLFSLFSLFSLSQSQTQLKRYSVLSDATRTHHGIHFAFQIVYIEEQHNGQGLCYHLVAVEPVLLPIRMCPWPSPLRDAILIWRRFRVTLSSRG